MKAFGVLYLFEWKKILGQRLVPAAILLAVSIKSFRTRLQ